MGYKKCQRISLLLKPHPISLKNVSWTWSQKVWYVRPPPSPIVNFQLPWWFLVMAFETNGLSLWSGCESSTMRPRRTRARSSSKGRSSSQAFSPRYASSLNPRWCIARLQDFQLPGNPGSCFQGVPSGFDGQKISWNRVEMLYHEKDLRTMDGGENLRYNRGNDYV